MKLWFFRDRLGQLFMSPQEPIKIEENVLRGWYMDPSFPIIIADATKHPDITYDNSPQLIEINGEV